MEKSIEEIWKSGFLDNKSLVAPRVNDLYNRKSEHLTEKFKRMFRFNLKAIALSSLIGFGGLLLIQLPITGIAYFITLVAVFIVNKRELNALEQVDQCQSSYDYLKAFDSWMKMQLSLNEKMAKFYYPFIFLGVALGIWFSPHGPNLYQMVGGESGDGWLINGIPGVLIIPILIIAAFLWLFGDNLYRLELNAFYGRVIEKLDELMTEMEELRKEDPPC